MEQHVTICGRWFNRNAFWYKMARKWHTAQGFYFVHQCGFLVILKIQSNGCIVPHPCFFCVCACIVQC